jgi:ParB family chromosome partitioning protein
MRLLKLPADIQAAVRDNVVSMGHARALVSAGDEALQMAIFSRIVEDGLSVRDAEALIKEGYVEPRNEDSTTRKSTPKMAVSETQYVFKEHLGDKLSARVDIKKSALGGGKIIVNFNSEVDLNRIIEILNR